jgi:murein DD-endopeptidase MepM/ murein hydrolase activator NlpD
MEAFTQFRTIRLLAILGVSGILAALPAAVSAATLSVSPRSVPQGGTVLLTVTPTYADGVTSVSGSVGSRIVSFFPYRGTWLGFYSAPAKASPATYRTAIVVNGRYPLRSTLTITNAKFPVTKLVVTDSLAALGLTPTVIAGNIAGNDSAALASASANPVKDPLFTSAFRYPLDGITGPGTTMNVGAFGNYRQSGGVKLQHLGVDLEAASGTPVYAANDGVVTLAARLVNYGNTLVVDHGARIFSVYMHLDRFAVAVGERVTKGQFIGYSGNTGYSIEPHLHLSVWVNGTSIDPLAFIAATQQAMR